MSPRKKSAKKTDVDLDNTQALEPDSGETTGKRPESPGRARPKDVEDIQAGTREIISHYPKEEASLIMVLQEVQDHFNWLPPMAIKTVAEELELPEARVLGVATFYKAFSLEPKGKKTIKVCMGTACHVRGAGMLVDELKRELKVEPGHGISADGAYSLETVNCIGACSMAPAIVVGDNYYANMTPGNIGKMLKKEQPK